VIKLRLRRMGAKKRPSYRIVAADSRSPRDGRIIESIGLYDPITDPATVRIDEARARHWLSVGAQPTDTVRHLLVRAGVTNGAVAAGVATVSAEAPVAEAPAEAEAEPVAEAPTEPAAEPTAEAKPRTRRRRATPEAE